MVCITHESDPCVERVPVSPVRPLAVEPRGWREGGRGVRVRVG